MIEPGIFQMLLLPARRNATFFCLTLLAGALGLAAPAAVLAQSADLLRAYQSFESAKAANKVSEALKAGDAAVKLTDAGGDKQGEVELLRNLGDFAAQADEDRPAAEYYQRALALQESALGPDHPDLVPVLTALANLKLKDERYSDAAALEQRILNIERRAYGEHHENVLATLNKLREIYRAGGDAAAVARIDAQALAQAPPPPPPPAGDRGLPGIPGGIAGTNRRYKQSQGFATVRVFYGTNRAPTGDLKPTLFYGKGRGELQYGYLNVTIPQIHKEAELETQPRWAEYTFVLSEASMRRRYVLLDQVTPLAKDDFVRALRQQIKDSPSKDLFIFVHGFNNTFEDAARRAAQMAYDLDFDGTPILYSIKLAGRDTIDMSAVPADILGHSYFAANSGAIYDIFRILWRGDPPPQRCGMSKQKDGGTLTVWWFNADACKGDEMLEAGVMLKRFGDLARERVMANMSALTDPSQKQQKIAWQLILDRLNGLLAPASAAPGGAAK